MYVYNNTTRLINPGFKLPLLPGENKLSVSQASYLSSFDLTVYVTGKSPMLTISETRIVQTEEDNSVVDKTTKKLADYVSEGGAKIMDATDGIPEEDETDTAEGDNSIASAIAARIAARTSSGG